MPRPRAYETDKVVDAAKVAFWEHGFEATPVDSLQVATGLSRSSIYQAFGTKRGLFDAALAEYTNSFIGPRLAPLEAPGAGLDAVASFFLGLATLFDDPSSHRGCLMINSIAEMAGADPIMATLGAQFANRLRSAFFNAARRGSARGALGRRQATSRAEFLTVAAMGAWVAVRVDHAAAAASCRAVAAEINSWDSSDIARRPGVR